MNIIDRIVEAIVAAVLALLTISPSPTPVQTAPAPAPAVELAPLASYPTIEPIERPPVEYPTTTPTFRPDVPTAEELAELFPDGPVWVDEDGMVRDANGLYDSQQCGDGCEEFLG